MKRVLAPRASAILYAVLCSVRKRQPFLLPANICPIVPITFLKAGMPFEFVDLSAHSLGMDISLIVERLEAAAGKLGGVLYAHTYGDPATPMEYFKEIRTRWPELLVIDDRCLCLPEFEQHDDTTADVILYSTGYAKITDIGFGGYAFLRDGVACDYRELTFDAQDLRQLEAQYKAAVDAGTRFEYRDSDWLQTQAVLPSWNAYAEQVTSALQPILEHRQTINAVYNSMIPGELQLRGAYQLWRFNLNLPLAAKARVLERIFAAGLFASSHYQSLVGIMGKGTGANAAALGSHVVNLFNDQHYDVAMAERTAQVVLRSL